ncbi:MAG: nucleoside deaminase [Spongiibacteraceae bacterium]|nr:nucleoside deaminase [Spongiibacteraceae bacterium]
MSNAIPSGYQLVRPEWLVAFQAQHEGQVAHDDEARAAVAIALSALSIDNGGGPFGAAVFDHANGRLLSVGCNLVMPANCSLWHAEMVALLFAQHSLQRFDLGPLPLTLATSCEPCVMCLGATLWSGVARVVSAATDADARAIGFDEGPKPADWAGALRERGVEVVTEVKRAEAQRELQRYVATGGVIYNAHRQ